MNLRRNRVGPAAVFCLLLVIVAIAWWMSRSQRAEVFTAPDTEQIGAPPHPGSRTSVIVGSSESDQRVRIDASVDFHLEEMSNSARMDPDAARILGAFVGMCSLALGNEYSGAMAERFEDLRWAPWLRECNRERLATLIKEMGTWAQPTGTGWDELEQVAGLDDSLEAMARRDVVTSRILEESNDPELVAAAARLYFDRERLRAWASFDLPNSLARQDVTDFRDDLALLLSCRVGGECSGGALETTAECAATSTCYPGLSMEQVIALRRSPQDMALIRRYVQRIVEKRGEA